MGISEKLLKEMKDIGYDISNISEIFSNQWIDKTSVDFNHIDEVILCIINDNQQGNLDIVLQELRYTIKEVIKGKMESLYNRGIILEGIISYLIDTGDINLIESDRLNYEIPIDVWKRSTMKENRSKKLKSMLDNLEDNLED